VRSLFLRRTSGCIEPLTTKREFILDTVVEALQTTGTLIWYTLWAFILGYLLSAILQVLVTREQMSRVLGGYGAKQATLSTFFGFISSSCSFASLAATRTVYSKGAHHVNALSFMIATTNLVIELGIVLWLLVGWKFVAANFLLGIMMIIYFYILAYFAFPRRIADAGRENAQRIEQQELKHPSPQGMRWWQKLTSLQGWTVISFKWLGEWKMAYKEVLVGFTLAGIVSAFVPKEFWNAVFLEAGAAAPSFVAVVQHALIAPFLAFFTFVGSLGNVPLASILWANNASFGGVLSFLGADLVAATVVYLNAKYYGWRFALLITGLLYICMVAAGVTVHYVFAAFDALPTARPESLMQMMEVGVYTHTFWLNIVFGIFAIVLLTIRHRAKKQES
jgi:uncharacterized membrane protein YraQ (UPF0718 family)